MKPMRYISLIIVLLSALGLAAQQQQSQYALYNYRNDGDFNAWLNIDVDSITYSNIGLDSVEYDNIVTQEVWTPDSCYRIPIEAIDSIGFRAPEPEYQDNVFHITTEHLPYITAVDSLTITFYSTLPVLMRPTVGQVVTSDTFEEPLSEGFAGKVLEINDDGEHVTIICEGANVTDVFKRLVLVGKGVGVNEEEAKNRPLRRPRNFLGDYENYDNIEFEFPGKVSVKIGDFISIEDHVSMSADYYIFVDLPRFKMRATATGTHNLKTNWTLDSDKVLEWMGLERDKFEPDWATPVWPVVNIPGVFNFGIRAGAFFDPSVKLSLTGSTPLTFTHTFGFEISNTDTGIFLPLVCPIVNAHSELGTPEISLSLEGKLFAGIALGLKATLIGDKVLSGDITGRFGPEFDAKIQMKQVLGEDEPITWYSLLKDSKVGIQLKADAKVKAKVFGENMTENLAWDWKWPIPGWEDTRYLFPDFTKPELPHYLMPEPLSLYSKASRDVIMPVQLGIGVFDEDGIKQREYYCEDWYLLDAENHSIPRVYIGDLPTGTKYTCRPIFNFSGIGEIKADPEIEFTIPEAMTLNLDTPLNSVTLKKGQELYVAINGGWGEYSAISSVEGLCSAEIIKNNDQPYVKISASKQMEGSAVVTVKDLRAGSTETILVTVSGDESPMICPDDNHPHLIDLGLPSGTKWSCCNVGASQPEAYGYYYQWGETTPVQDGENCGWNNSYAPGGVTFTGTSYSDCCTAKDPMYVDGTIYQDADGQWTCNISGNAKYDAATANWGGSWRMFTDEELNELYMNCTFETASRNGVSGCEVKSNINNNVIFFPAAGCRYGTDTYRAGSFGSYWLPTLWGGTSCYPNGWYFGSDEDEWQDDMRCCGRTVRPVSTAAPVTLALSESSVTISQGNTTTVNITSGSGSYSVSSSNASKATATVEGNVISITGKTVGAATITVTDTQTHQTATVEVTVTSGTTPDPGNHAWVDLGLPSGTKWATCNVGASSPEEYGDYFAWGETTPKNQYDWSTYKWMNSGQSSSSQINKYTFADYQTDACWYSNGTFVGDGKTELDPEDDAAAVNWGSGWQMPSIDQIDELSNSHYTTTEWTTQGGVNGRKITSKSNGNSIFLPAAGYRDDTRLYGAGSVGSYCSRSLYSSYSDDACVLGFNSSSFNWCSDYRSSGNSVRPVRVQN